MKKRRLVVVAFLMATVLTLGVGYAAITGTLGVTGRVEFNGTGVVSTEVNQAVKFTDAVAGENCTASITGDHAADMVVTFNDTEGNIGDVFTATATFTITYDTTDTTLPAVDFAVPAPSITSAAGSQGFAITTNWSAPQTLAPTQTVDVIVTVTYTNQDPAVTGTVSAAINVPMPFMSADTNP